jgi:hypothetical protein
MKRQKHTGPLDTPQTLRDQLHSAFKMASLMSDKLFVTKAFNIGVRQKEPPNFNICPVQQTVRFVFCVCVLCVCLCLTLVYVLPHCLAQGKYKFAQSFKCFCECVSRRAPMSHASAINDLSDMKDAIKKATR